MSDETTAGPDDSEAPAEGPSNGGAEGGQPQQALVVNAQYIKDLSFEAPTTPGVFAMLQQQQPDIGLSVNVSVNHAQDNMYEVVLSTRAECKIGETVCFVAELDYGGLFTVNVEEQYRQAVLLIECPRMLFPFSRHLMSVVTRDGGFPPLMIGPLDFVSMYQQRMNELSKQSEGGESSEPAS